MDEKEQTNYTLKRVAEGASDGARVLLCLKMIICNSNSCYSQFTVEL